MFMARFLYMYVGANLVFARHAIQTMRQELLTGVKK